MAGNKFSFRTVVGIDTGAFKQGVKDIQHSINGLWSSFSNFSAALGAGLGLAALVSRIKETTLELSSAEAVLKNVSKTSLEYAENQQFLARLAKDYHQNLLDLSQGWGQFEAAATACNVSLDNQRKIYEALTKAAAFYHMSGDQTKYMMLAITQMMSKGKVQAEELRRQLGNSLPGAFGLMAKAIGVSTEEMESMMKAGKVLADDALPKFADELNKITQNGDFTSLQLAMNDLANAWTNIISSGDFDNIIAKIVDKLTSTLTWIGDHIKGITTIVSGLVTGIIAGKLLKGLFSIYTSVKGLLIKSRQITTATIEQLAIENKLVAAKKIQSAEHIKQTRNLNKLITAEAKKLGLDAAQIAILRKQTSEYKKQMGFMVILKALMQDWGTILTAVGMAAGLGFAEISSEMRLFKKTASELSAEGYEKEMERIASLQANVSYAINEQLENTKSLVNTEKQREEAFKKLDEIASGTKNTPLVQTYEEVLEKIKQYGEAENLTKKENEELLDLKKRQRDIENNIVSHAEEAAKIANAELKLQELKTIQQQLTNKEKGKEGELEKKKAAYLAEQEKYEKRLAEYRKAKEYISSHRYGQGSGGQRDMTWEANQRIVLDFEKSGKDALNRASTALIEVQGRLDANTNAMNELEATLRAQAPEGHIDAFYKLQQYQAEYNHKVAEIERRKSQGGYLTQAEYRKDRKDAAGSMSANLKAMGGSYWATSLWKQVQADAIKYESNSKSKSDAQKAEEKMIDILNDYSNEVSNLNEDLKDGKISQNAYNESIKKANSSLEDRVRKENDWKDTLDRLDKNGATITGGAYGGKGLKGVFGGVVDYNSKQSKVNDALIKYNKALEKLSEESKLYGWTTEEYNNKLLQLKNNTLASIISMDDFQFELDKAGAAADKFRELLDDATKENKKRAKKEQDLRILDATYGRPEMGRNPWDIGTSYSKKPHESLKDAYDETKAYVDELNSWIEGVYKMDASTREQLKPALEKAIEEVAQVRETLPDMFRKALAAKVEQDLKDLRLEMFEKSYQGVKGIAESADRMVNSVRALDDAMDSDDGWEQFMAIFSVITQAVDTVLSTVKMVKELNELSTQLGQMSVESLKNLELQAELKLRKDITKEMMKQNALAGIANGEIAAETAAIAGNTAAKASNVAASEAQAAADTGAAVAAGADTIAQVADTTATVANTASKWGNVKAKLAAWFAANPIAGLAMIAGVGAAIGAIGSMINSAKGYAKGGIVGGTSYTGDKVLSRLNSGEMVLTKAQQSTLFNAIKGGNLGGGIGKDVKFVIHGSDLVGTISNYNRKKRG